MKKIIRLTESDLTRLVRRVLKEQITIPTPATGEDKDTHRRNQGFQSPGFETFFADPLNDGIVGELMYELENDKFAKGKIVVIFNGAKYKNIGELIQKIQADARRDTCYTITEYEYNNRVSVVNTQITIKATPGKCKKEEIANPQPDNTQPDKTQPDNSQNVDTQPQVKCYWGTKIPRIGSRELTKTEILVFQEWCSKPDETGRTDRWKKEYNNGTSKKCGKNDADGEWGCCSATCWNNNYRKFLEDFRKAKPFSGLFK